jgi:hypothetical protein
VQDKVRGDNPSFLSNFSIVNFPFPQKLPQFSRTFRIFPLSKKL